MNGPAPLHPWQRILLAFVPLLVLLAFALILYDSMSERSASTERVQQGYRRMIDLHELRTRLVDAETGQRGYIITGDSAYLAPYRDAARDVRRLLAALGQGTALPLQAQLARQTTRRLEIIDRALAARARGFEAAREQLVAGRGMEAMAQLRVTLAAIEQAEQRRLAEEIAAQLRAGHRMLLTLAIGALIVLLVGAATWQVLWHHSRQLERLTEQLQEQSIELELQSQELQLQTVQLEENSERLQALNLLLDRRSQEAEAANVAKTTFLRTMSHELRTPLNAINGYSDLLGLGIQGPLTAQQRASVDRIKFNSHHLLALVNDVLSFARLEAGRLELHPEPLDVQQLFEEAEQLLRPLLDVQRIEFRALPAPPGLAIHADADRTRQILLNLLGNAVKHTGGYCTVELSAAADDDCVRISVRDTGPGIPQDVQDRIFEPFVQVTVPGSAANAGAGLGLSISRGLAQAMGGDISLQSHPGHGSCFTLVLPRSSAIPAAPPQSAV